MDIHDSSRVKTSSIGTNISNNISDDNNNILGTLVAFIPT